MDSNGSPHPAAKVTIRDETLDGQVVGFMPADRVSHDLPELFRKAKTVLPHPEYPGLYILRDHADELLCYATTAEVQAEEDRLAAERVSGVEWADFKAEVGGLILARRTRFERRLRFLQFAVISFVAVAMAFLLLSGCVSDPGDSLVTDPAGRELVSLEVRQLMYPDGQTATVFDSPPLVIWVAEQDVLNYNLNR